MWCGRLLQSLMTVKNDYLTRTVDENGLNNLKL